MGKGQQWGKVKVENSVMLSAIKTKKSLLTFLGWGCCLTGGKVGTADRSHITQAAACVSSVAHFSTLGQEWLNLFSYYVYNI